MDLRSPNNECRGMSLRPKSLDVIIAVTFGVMISVYKLGPLLKEITEKERLQLEQRRSRMAELRHSDQ